MKVLSCDAADVTFDGKRKLDPRLQTFFAAKAQHARELTEERKQAVAPEVWSYFDAGIKGDWNEVASWWQELRRRSGQYNNTRMDESVRTIAWHPVLEAQLAYEGFSELEVKFIDAFAKDVIDSIPRGAVYFGGTDYGRGLITALCKSHADADPFFTLTQNALADGSYLEYLRAIYGKKLKMATDADSKKAFDAYIADAGARLEKDALKSGEQVSKDDKGRYSVGGHVAVMAINGQIAKTIFENNPKREFFIEESFPLDWMTPHLSPTGLIMKINRKPLSEMTAAMVKKDHAYWQKQLAKWIGDWVTEQTDIQQIGEFTERVYAELNLEGFKGDRDFVMADRRNAPQQMYGKLRSAQAAVYSWRAKNAATTAERERMAQAADFAYRQAFALGPWSHDVVFPYEEFLRSRNRAKDADALVEWASRSYPGDKRLRQRARELKDGVEK